MSQKIASDKEIRLERYVYFHIFNHKYPYAAPLCRPGFSRTLFKKYNSAPVSCYTDICRFFLVVRETIVQKSNNGIPEKVNYQSFL